MRSLPSDEDAVVPDVLDISEDDFLKVYPTWLQWRATGGRISPLELRKQPQSLMDAIIYLDAIFERMLAQQRKQENAEDA